MERVLITGAAGFIGSHVVEHLLKNTDWEILILDKLSYASSGLDRLTDVQAVNSVLKDFQQNRVSFYATDITMPIPVGLMKEIGSVDYILHMAAETHVDNSIADPWPFVNSNVIGTYHILEFARRCDHLKKFIYFSTDEVFGPAASLPLPGHITARGPQLGQYVEWRDSYSEWDRYNSTNPYSATKAAAEELCLAWANTYGVPMAITHTMNNFGERQHPEKFIPLVVRKILQEDSITVHCNATREQSGSRYYIHARNTADAILFLLEHQALAKRDKFNIVGEKEVTNLDLVYLIEAMLQKVVDPKLKARVSKVDFHSSRPGHDLRYSLDGSKMKHMGWEPPNTFEASLEKTIKWMVDHRNLKWLLLAKEAVR